MTVTRTPAARLARGVLLLPLLSSPLGLAQSEGPAPMGDSVQYFFEKAKLVAPHPSRSGIGDHGLKSPLEIWKGDNDSFLRTTFQAQALYATQEESWFGQDEANLGAASNSWWETGIIPGVIGSYFSGNGDEIYGELNFVATSTQDIDPAGSNVAYGDASDVWAEKAYLGWRSGTLWADLGKDFLDVSLGRQQYVAGNGFLFFSQSSNGGKRGGYWLGIRKTADLAGIVQVNYKDLAVDLIHLEADDQNTHSEPNNNTEVDGVTLDYSLGDFGGIGGGYYNVSAQAKPRDGLDIVDARFGITPFKQFMPNSVLAPLDFEGEYVKEDNGDALDASAWYLSARYDFKDLPWSPSVTYRYAGFEGDDPDSGKNESYDPLFYGFYDWGYWFQGEVLGEYVLSNSNLNSDMLKVGLDPTDSLHVNMFYYHFELDQAESFGVQSSTFADEWNLTLDWTVNDYLMFSVVGAYVSPDKGAKQYTGGNDDWMYLMLQTSFTLK